MRLPNETRPRFHYTPGKGTARADPCKTHAHTHNTHTHTHTLDLLGKLSDDPSGGIERIAHAGLAAVTLHVDGVEKVFHTSARTHRGLSEIR